MDDQASRDLARLQQQIYREKILRARAMSVEERLAEVFELTNEVMIRILDGARARSKGDEALAWDDAWQRLSRLRAVNDRGRFTTEQRSS